MKMEKTSRKTSTKASKKTTKKTTKKTSKKILIGLAALVVVAGVAFAGIYFKVKSDIDAMGQDVVYTGVTVEGEDASGMTAEELKAVLETKLAEKQAGKVVLTRGETQVESTLGEIGLVLGNADEAVAKAVAYGKEGSYFQRYREVKALAEEPVNIDVTFDLDEAVTETMITTLAESLKAEPKNASALRQKGKGVLSR